MFRKKRKTWKSIYDDHVLEGEMPPRQYYFPWAIRVRLHEDIVVDFSGNHAVSLN